MKLYLIQNKERIMGQGVMIRDNSERNATASGSILGTKLSLNVMPVGILDLYELNLPLSSLDSGTYTAYMADGSNTSGNVSFTVSTDIFQSGSKNPEQWI